MKATGMEGMQAGNPPDTIIQPPPEDTDDQDDGFADRPPQSLQNRLQQMAVSGFQTILKITTC